MTGRIFRSIVLASLLSLLLCFVLITGILYEYFAEIETRHLATELSLARTAVEAGGLEYLEAVGADGCRLTWVAADGSVLYDTKADAESMKNHADREEIQEALKTGSGESRRYSSTLTERTLYCARLLSDGTVLRISVENATVLSLVLGMLHPLVVIILLLLVLSGILAGRMSKRIVDPLNRLDLEHPLENDAYDELSPLLRRISQLHGQLDRQLREARVKSDEFAHITENMNEGLVLLDDSGKVLSINNAALTLFGARDDCVGRDFITVDRSRETTESIKRAAAVGHSELRWEKEGREYQLDISRVESDGKTVGTVLLAFDITDKVFAERNRREFTANVSHELKTPLQSIMGSVELIENGLVRPEDMPRFIGRIRAESARLVALIEDIIRLSMLDEGGETAREDVDLRELAEEAVDELKYAAEAKNVTLSLTGDKTVVRGVRKLLFDVVFNLCDNAIKYNRDGGRVDITVSAGGGSAVLTVGDTGIGIPPEHQSRVFERFYRVDKSRSKESGGTGLGLSIVKHAVMYHNGKLRLRSREGEGSVFTVTLPTD